MTITLHSLPFIPLTALAAVALLTLSSTTKPALEEFDIATLRVEYNATDDDAEVVLFVDVPEGLDRLRVIDPNGKEILNVRAKNAQDLGIRKLNLETPEPSLASVLAAYPAGPYRFLGRTVEGELLASTAWLSHDLPAAAQFSFPQAGQSGIPLAGAAAAWGAVPGATGYFLELENDDLGVDVKSHIAAAQVSFGFPTGWLFPNTQYVLSIGAVGASGNLTVTQLDFTTGN